MVINACHFISYMNYAAGSVVPKTRSSSISLMLTYKNYVGFLRFMKHFKLIL